MDESVGVDIAKVTVESFGLPVDDAVALQCANRVAVRLLPCDVLVRVAPASHLAAATYEIELAPKLAAAGCPVEVPDPRVEPIVHTRDDHVVTVWTFYESTGEPLTPPSYADALMRLHAGMRQVDVDALHFTDRVAHARRIVGDPEVSPVLGDEDRALLVDALETVGDEVGGRDEQLLHGEPHPGNVLVTADGPRFVDLETCCRGPVEFEVAHTPDAVADHYVGLDRDVLRSCRLLMMAMVAAWRADRDDRYPNGHAMLDELVRRLRAGLRT